eukprot:scaffold91132_cov32-Tisochrysis_lutea.AAC.5
MDYLVGWAGCRCRCRGQRQDAARFRPRSCCLLRLRAAALKFPWPRAGHEEGQGNPCFATSRHLLGAMVTPFRTIDNGHGWLMAGGVHRSQGPRSKFTFLAAKGIQQVNLLK